MPRPRKVRLIIGAARNYAGHGTEKGEISAIAQELQRAVEELGETRWKPLEQTMPSWDGTELFYRAWFPDGKQAEKALLLFHRGHEHSGRWQETVDSLGLENVAIFAWDARGHGRSPGERGAARELTDVIKDVDAFVRQIAERYGIALENMIVLAHSLAAVTVGAWVHDYAPPIRALILATAAFEVKLYIPLAIPGLRLQQKLFRGGQVKSYVRAKMLTHDPVEAARYEADPLIFRQIAINLLLDLHDTARRLLADAGAIQVPTLMLAAGRDYVVESGSAAGVFPSPLFAAEANARFPGDVSCDFS